MQYFKNRDTNAVEGEQDNRIVYELIAADTVETTTYSGVGISTDTDFKRPTMWRKQTNDLIIDGVRISKERNYLEPQIQPTTGIIKSITPSDTKIYVKDSWLFQQVDNLGQTKNDINIKFTLNTLLNDFHVKETKEAAAKTETKRIGIFRLILQ